MSFFWSIHQIKFELLSMLNSLHMQIKGWRCLFLLKDEKYQGTWWDEDHFVNLHLLTIHTRQGHIIVISPGVQMQSSRFIAITSFCRSLTNLSNSELLNKHWNRSVFCCISSITRFLCIILMPIVTAIVFVFILYHDENG